MTKAFLQCIIPGCGKKYEVSEVRTECDCGNLLDVRYNWSADEFRNFFEMLAYRRYDVKDIFNESGVWRFRELLPFVDLRNYKEVLVSLDGDEGKTKPFHLSAVADYVGLSSENFYLQFEGRNPTGSFKDNGMSAAFTHAKMLGIKQVACASTGNTAASMAAYAANEGITSIIFIGKGRIAMGKLAQALEYGAMTIQIDGDFDDAMNRVKELSKKTGLYLVNSVNPFRLEGQKTIMYRVLEGLDWKMPDWIVVPGGNLGNCSAFGKAFEELKELKLIKSIPRIAIINAEGANTLYELYNNRKLKWNNGRVNEKIINDYYNELDEKNKKSDTIASAIAIMRPVNLKKALRALEIMNGVVEQVSDEEIMDAKAMVGRNGFGCEPASAASVAGIKKLVEKGIIKKGEVIVGILTGHQLKDPEATINYHSANHKFSNTPIEVANDIKEIMKLIK